VKAAPFGVLAVVAGAALLLSAPASAGTHITRAQRATINRELDILVNDGVKRENPVATYDIVTPEMKYGMTRKAWAKGSIPIYPFPAAGKHFHGWFVKYATPHEIGIEILLQPRKGVKIGAVLFDVYFDKVHGHWLVEEILPEATFAPAGARPKVRSIADFSPQGGLGGVSSPSKVSSSYAWIPFLIVPGIMVALILVVVTRMLRDRRRGEIPPSLRRARAR
jgi:hypothetical protein